jgi:hypothetical protein
MQNTEYCHSQTRSTFFLQLRNASSTQHKHTGLGRPAPAALPEYLMITQSIGAGGNRDATQVLIQTGDSIADTLAMPPPHTISYNKSYYISHKQISALREPEQLLLLRRSGR